MRVDLPGLLGRFAWGTGLISAGLLYTMGAGIGRYLGAQFQLYVALVGFLWTAAIVLFTYFTFRYFDLRAAAENLGRKLLGGLPWRTGMLAGVIVTATLAAWSSILLIRSGDLTQGAGLMMLLGVGGACLYAIPPLRLGNSGYGELLLSVMMGAGIPALAFMLLYGGYHRYLAMTAFPISALHLSMLIALALPRYAHHEKYEIQTIVTRMRWDAAMTTHNLLILSAFLLLAISVLFGFPRFAFYPTMLALPLGFLDVYYMIRIAGGLSPNWNALTLSSVALYLLPTYFLALSFWTH